ncbi:MAG: biotin/lipoyl-binding protein [Phycisphaerales bacterium]|nr:biotin/lipoyl-binding protein [Phycisphaerales bacterium]
MTRNAILVSASGLLVAVGGAVGIGPATAAAGVRPAQPTANSDGVVDTAIARTMSFLVTTTATGDLQAAKQIEIRNPLDQQTTITEIVKEGSRVKMGDVIVKLNSQQIEQQIAQEQLAVESARANLAVAENALMIQESDNESAMRKATLDLEVAKLELRQWAEGDVKSKRQALDLALEKAQRELQRLQEKFERSRSLNAEGFLSTDEMKRDELAYLEADANLKTATLNKEVYNGIEYAKDQKVKESAVEEAQASRDRTSSLNRSKLESRRAELNNSRETLKLREANLDKYNAQLASATIKAPQDGLVVYASSLERDRFGGQGTTIDVGQQVYPNALILALPDVTEMIAAVRVHESLAGRIRPDMTATVKVDAMGGKSVPGRVLSVGVIAESGGWRDPNLREYTVRVRLDVPDVASVLKPSMRCEAEITLDRVTDALAVPVQAVFSEGLVRYVLTPQGDKYVRSPIKVGRRSERFIEILAGIGEGQPVLLRVPRTGELIDRPWTTEALAAVGLQRVAEGRIEPVGGAPSGLPGGGGTPGGGKRPAGAPKAAPGESAAGPSAPTG